MDDSQPYHRARVRRQSLTRDDRIDAVDTVPLIPGSWQFPEVEAQESHLEEPTHRLPPPKHPRRRSRTTQRGVNRRKLLVGAGAGAVGLGLLGTGAAAYLERQQSQLLTNSKDGGTHTDVTNPFAQETTKIGHLLRRAGFGASPADLPEYLSLGVAGTLDRLLNYSHVANDALEARLRSFSFDFTKRDDLIHWVVLRMLYSQRPFEEKLTLFWHGVLTSGLTKLGPAKRFPWMMQQYELLRAKGLGRFDDLMRAITVDPAMLFWLDGQLNSGALPNENYAREVMELFTMGIGNYTQNDVHQGALALTGWVVKDDGAHFVPARHYNGSVRFLGHTGPMTVDDVVRIVCAHPNTGGHLARRMWRFFVYDNPSPKDLLPIAQAYYKNNHSIAAMVKAMFSSPAFFSPQAYRARVKSPLEFVVGAIRALGLETTAGGITGPLTAMGQVPLDPPNVAGWPGDGASAAWMSTQSWIMRINFIDHVVSKAAGVPSKSGLFVNLTSPKGHSAIQQAITRQKLASADDVVRYYASVLLDGVLDRGRRAVMASAITKSSVKGGPTFTLSGGQTISAAATAEMLYLLMSLPEYQMN